MNENAVTGHEVLNHYEPVISNVDVLQVVSSHAPVYYGDWPASVWTYVYPGRIRHVLVLENLFCLSLLAAYFKILLVFEQHILSK